MKLWTNDNSLNFDLKAYFEADKHYARHTIDFGGSNVKISVKF